MANGEPRLATLPATAFRVIFPWHRGATATGNPAGPSLHCLPPTTQVKMIRLPCVKSGFLDLIRVRGIDVGSFPL